MADHHSPEFMVALRKEPERVRRAFQIMGSIAMNVICSDSQVQSVHPACVFLKTQLSVWHASVTRKLTQTQTLELLTVLLTYYMRYR